MKMDQGMKVGLEVSLLGGGLGYLIAKGHEGAMAAMTAERHRREENRQQAIANYQDHLLRGIIAKQTAAIENYKTYIGELETELAEVSEANDFKADFIKLLKAKLKDGILIRS